MVDIIFLRCDKARVKMKINYWLPLNYITSVIFLHLKIVNPMSGNRPLKIEIPLIDFLLLLRDYIAAILGF